MTYLKSLVSSVALGAGIFVASSAHAVLITEWNFSADNDWINTTFSSPGPLPPTDNFEVSPTLPDGSDPNGAGGNYDTIKWGTPATAGGRSFLSTDDNHSSSGLFTNDTTGIAGANVYHGNYRQQQSGEQWLDATTLLTSITVTPVTPPGSGVGPINRQFEVEFTETVDTPDIGSCPGAPWPGGVSPCPDVFVADMTNATFDIQIDEYIYTFRLFFDFDNSENISRIEQEDSTATIWTEEGVRSRLATRIVVEARRVPEPVPLALFGSGLLALGLLRGRSNRKI